MSVTEFKPKIAAAANQLDEVQALHLLEFAQALLATPATPHAEDIEALDCTAETSRLYARCKIELKHKGRPINENDIWIAATAIQYRLSLVSRHNDFAAVENSTWVKW